MIHILKELFLMKVYKCFSSDFAELEKKIKRITKKLDKNNLKWSFEVLGESVEEVAVWDYVNRDNVPQFSPKKVGTVVVDVTSYTFEMESLKLGEFEVLAVIEHNAIEGTNENIIHVIKENASIPVEYRTVKSYCQHCKSDRKRNKTVLLINAENEIIQVGSTCIKEYTGIDGLSIIGNYQDIHNIILEELSIDYDGSLPKSKYVKTLDYLTNCINLISTEGYKKDDTKYGAWDMTTESRKDVRFEALAQEIITYFQSREFKEYETFQNNIKLYLYNEYTKKNGIIAYAYVAYQKEIEKDLKKAKEEEGKKDSNYVGNIGEKIQTELTFINSYSFDTEWGTSHIHKFQDQNGNIFIWKSSNSLGKWDEKGNYIHPEQGQTVKIKGTIKNHSEYAEAKQTILTRCKIA